MKRQLVISSAGALALLSLSLSVASAHVVVKPAQVGIAAFQTLYASERFLRKAIYRARAEITMAAGPYKESRFE